MRLLPALVQLSALAAASPQGIFARRDAQDVLPTDDDLKIPGESPLELCPKEHEVDIIQIESVDLLPNPPQA